VKASTGGLMRTGDTSYASAITRSVRDESTVAGAPAERQAFCGGLHRGVGEAALHHGQGGRPNVSIRNHWVSSAARGGGMFRTGSMASSSTLTEP
jgi:hypothetical protein